MCGAKAKSPPPPPPLPPPPVVNEQADKKQALAARTNEAKKIALAKGQEDTILTGSLGVQGEANTKKKVLVGE